MNALLAVFLLWWLVTNLLGLPWGYVIGSLAVNPRHPSDRNRRKAGWLEVVLMFGYFSGQWFAKQTKAVTRG